MLYFSIFGVDADSWRIYSLSKADKTDSYKERVMSYLGVVAGLVIIASWFTHIIVCLKAASWGFLIAGAIFFPVAVVHGVGIWFGAF